MITENSTIVVAYDKNFGIGKDGKIPWRIPADMAHFKKLTMDQGEDGVEKGSVVIMGRKTFESFRQKFRPLPVRINVILSRNGLYQPIPTNSKTFVCSSLNSAAILFHRENICRGKKVFIIGGGEIYKEALLIKLGEPFFVDKIIATEVDGIFDCDTFFNIPPFYKYWRKKELGAIQKDDINPYSCKIIEYSR